MTEIERINLEISKRKCEITELESQKKEEEEKAKYTRWKPKKGEKYYFISFDCKGFEPDELINEYYKPEKEK